MRMGFLYKQRCGPPSLCKGLSLTLIGYLRTYCIERNIGFFLIRHRPNQYLRDYSKSDKTSINLKFQTKAINLARIICRNMIIESIISSLVIATTFQIGSSFYSCSLTNKFWRFRIISMIESTIPLLVGLILSNANN